MVLSEALASMLADHPILFPLGLLLTSLFLLLAAIVRSFKQGPNPFSQDRARPPGPLVTDQAARDRVIKQGFNVKKVPSNLDAIVIGSGIGGLCTAALMSKVGKKVLVLEQHDQAGGCCHTFIDKGFEFDIGIHYVGDVHMDTPTKLLADQITEGQLQWSPLDDPYDYAAFGKPGEQKFYPQYAGIEKWSKKMKEMFPKDVEAIDKALALFPTAHIEDVGIGMAKVLPRWMVNILLTTGLIKLFTSFFNRSHKSLKDILDSLTDNKILKSVLAYAFGDYGCLPSDCSFAMHCMMVTHFQPGSAYPVGGASEISFHIIPVIEKSGGRVLVRARVSKILLGPDGRAIGVRVDKGQNSVDIMAPVIISACGMSNTFNDLLPKEVSEKTEMAKILKKRKLHGGFAGLITFVGLRGTKEELGLKAANIWAFTGYDTETGVKNFLNMTAEEAADGDVPILFISFPSAKDPMHNVRYPGKSTCIIASFGNWEWFKEWNDKAPTKRGVEYEALRNRLGLRMWEQTLAIYPHLADKVEYISYSSPVTNSYYIGAERGEWYGLDHTKVRFAPEVYTALRPEVPEIPGLYLSGQDVLTGSFAGAMFGGLFAAGKVLKRELYSDLRFMLWKKRLAAKMFVNGKNKAD